MVETAVFRLFLVVFNVAVFLLIVLLSFWKQDTQNKKALQHINFAIICLLVILIFQYAVYAYARYLEPNWIKIEEVNISNKSFPEGIQDLKIIHVSDLHIKKVGFRERQFVAKINRLKPDLVLITGDFLTYPEGVDAVVTILSKLKAEKGIFGIFGDIDKHAFRKGNLATFKAQLGNAGIRILDNESAVVSFSKVSIALIGFTNPRNNYAFKGVDLSLPKIVLLHEPELIKSEYLRPDTADLVLAGDTHGGQLGLPFIKGYSELISNFAYLSGLYYVKGVPLYVNRGVGMHGMGIRFFCRPEITVIKLLKG